MKKKDQIVELNRQIDELKSNNQSLLELAGRFGHENQKLKSYIQQIKKDISNGFYVYSSAYAINNHLSEETRKIIATIQQQQSKVKLMELCDSYLNAI